MDRMVMRGATMREMANAEMANAVRYQVQDPQAKRGRPPPRSTDTTVAETAKVRAAAGRALDARLRARSFLTSPHSHSMLVCVWVPICAINPVLPAVTADHRRARARTHSPPRPRRRVAARPWPPCRAAAPRRSASPPGCRARRPLRRGQSAVAPPPPSRGRPQGAVGSPRHPRAGSGRSVRSPPPARSIARRHAAGKPRGTVGSRGQLQTNCCCRRRHRRHRHPCRRRPCRRLRRVVCGPSRARRGSRCQR